MALGKTSQVVWLHICNTPFVNFAGCDVTLFDKLAYPRRGLGVDFVVVGRHAGIPIIGISTPIGMMVTVTPGVSS